MSQENSPQIRAINLSMKLLNTVSSPPVFAFNRSITSLQELGSRLQSANLNYAYRRNDRQTAKEWLFDRGVNLSSVQDIAREVKKKQHVQKVKRVEFNHWERLEFEGFDGLEQEDLLHFSEERTAHTAIKLSLETGKNNSHLNNLTRELVRAVKQEGKQPQPATRDIKEEDLLEEFIARYEEEENNQTQTPIHKTVQKVININKSLWFRILYYQIEMVEYLGNDEVSKHNELLTVSLKELEKSAKERHNFSNDFWKSAYFEYRAGSCNFAPSKYVQDNELFKALRQIQNSVNKFQEISVDSSIDLSRGDDSYERILKLIVLGKYEEGMFEDRIVDDAWLMILSTGLKRGQRSEKEQSEQFKRGLKALIANHKEKHLQGEQGLQELLAVLLSIGAYDRIIKIYQQLNDKNKLNANNRMLFVQLFILLASNTELVEQFHPSTRKNALSKGAHNIITNLVSEIAYFAEGKKNSKFRLYSVLVVVLFKIARNLQKFDEDMDDIADSISDILKLSPTDLWNGDHYTLSEIAVSSEYARKIINRTLVAAKPHSNDDYLKLAELCRIFRANSLIEHIFLRFLIISELERPSAKTQAIQESDEIINDIMEALEPTISKQHASILKFLMSLRSLRELIHSRSVDQLHAKRQMSESYLSDSSLIESLLELCSKQGADLLEIYIVYYEQIYAMQKMTLLSRSNISSLRKRQVELAEQLQRKRQKYPDLNSLRLGRLIGELSK